MIIDGIEVIGIDDKFPNELKYFNEELIWTFINKPKDNPDINKIVSVSVNTNVISYKILDTLDNTFSDKINSLDKTIGVEVNFYFRIKYTTNSHKQYIYTINYEMSKILYMCMPNAIDGVSIEELVRHKKINIIPYIADIYAREKDYNSVYLRILFYLTSSMKNNF